LGWTVLAGLLLALVSAKTAGAEAACSEDGFCVTENLTLTSNPPGLVAGAPLSIDLSAENTSTPLDQAHWLHMVSLSVSGGNLSSTPPLSPSSQLPNGLLLAGGSPCSPPYTTCAGGHGTLLAHLSGIGEIDTTGAFGISKIANINPPAPGAYADYRVTIRACINLGSCQQQEDRTEEIKVTVVNQSFEFTTDGADSFLGYTAEYAINSIFFHLNGQSDQLESGPAPQTYTILTVPTACETLTGTATYVSREAGSISIPHSATVTGCGGGPPPSKTRAPARPNTKLVRSRIKSRRAAFAFRGTGVVTGFHCRLTFKRRPQRRFSRCRSPKVYRHLGRGRYTFRVRAVGPGGADQSPAKRKFSIP
jgi:hypothetical protein